MSFLTNVKLGNITNLSDARYAAAAGVTYIGFCFDPANENYIAPIKAKEIIDWVTGSSVVAEFGNQSLEEIRDISELLNVDAIEVENRLLPDELISLGKPVIKKISLSEYSEAQLLTETEAYQPVADAFHLYRGDELNASLLKDLCARYQIIWGFPVEVSSVINTLQTYSPFALNLSGGLEEKAGIKDFDEMNELFELIYRED